MSATTARGGSLVGVFLFSLPSLWSIGSQVRMYVGIHVYSIWCYEYEYGTANVLGIAGGVGMARMDECMHVYGAARKGRERRAQRKR